MFLTLFLTCAAKPAPAKHTDLIHSLKPVEAIGYKLDKQRTINSDPLDGSLLSLKNYQIE
jgi:hypothetical protein